MRSWLVNILLIAMALSFILGIALIVAWAAQIPNIQAIGWKEFAAGLFLTGWPFLYVAYCAKGDPPRVSR